MGHPIHKHMNSGMKSAERYDAKEAYNKNLDPKARLHYLENNIADKKGSPAHMEGGRKDHKMSNSEYSAHLQSPKGKKEHGAGMSRYGSDYGDSAAEFNKGLRDASAKGKLDSNPKFKAIVNAAPSRKSSPANNVSYGDKSGKTGYIGEAKYDMKYNAVDDITQGKGKADYGMSRQSSPLNGHGYHAKKKK